MELSDFGAFLVLGILIGVPLGAILIVLRRFGWHSSRGFLLDAIIVWLTWFITNLSIFEALAIIDKLTRGHIFVVIAGSTMFVLFALILGFISSTFSVAMALRIVSNRSEDRLPVMAEHPSEDRTSLPGVFRTSFAATISATLAFSIVFGILAAADKTYERYYHPSYDGFQIYDI